jgi:chlorobactene glucosyltransferase
MIGFIFSSLLFVLFIGLTVWIHRYWRLDWSVPPPPPLPDDLPLISVMIPARNEARNIRQCVQTVLDQNYPRVEVIVLDDRSTDATSTILAEIQASAPNLKIIAGKPLPDGWAGKPHALHQAFAHAQGEYLCFIDADTFLAPDCLAAVWHTAKTHDAGLFSMLTDQTLDTFWERTILPIVFTAMSVAFQPRRINDPDTPDAIANGQFLFFSRQTYDAIGGHESVADSVVEDLALARHVKGSGARLLVADGRPWASTRMYTSLPEIWEGWTKNIYLGLQGKTGLLLFGMFGTLLSVVLMLGWLPTVIVWWVIGGGTWAVAAVAQAVFALGYMLTVRMQAARGMGLPAWYGLTTPLGTIMLCGMVWNSTLRALTGRGVTWKGRVYRV